MYRNVTKWNVLITFCRGTNLLYKSVQIGASVVRCGSLMLSIANCAVVCRSNPAIKLPAMGQKFDPYGLQQSNRHHVTIFKATICHILSVESQG